jgi:hypothetical protein
MYPAMLVPLVFIVLMGCIERGAPDDRKLLGQIGLCFAVIAGASIVTDYVIQRDRSRVAHFSVQPERRRRESFGRG